MLYRYDTDFLFAVTFLSRSPGIASTDSVSRRSTCALMTLSARRNSAHHQRSPQDSHASISLAMTLVAEGRRRYNAVMGKG
jgi:hypothetical protein